MAKENIDSWKWVSYVRRKQYLISQIKLVFRYFESDSTL